MGMATQQRHDTFLASGPGKSGPPRQRKSVLLEVWMSKRVLTRMVQQRRTILTLKMLMSMQTSLKLQRPAADLKRNSRLLPAACRRDLFHRSLVS